MRYFAKKILLCLDFVESLRDKQDFVKIGGTSKGNHRGKIWKHLKKCKETHNKILSKSGEHQRENIEEKWKEKSENTWKKLKETPKKNAENERKS